MLENLLLSVNDRFYGNAKTAKPQSTSVQTLLALREREFNVTMM
jgi:hypothetical protein